MLYTMGMGFTDFVAPQMNPLVDHYLQNAKGNFVGYVGKDGVTHMYAKPMTFTNQQIVADPLTTPLTDEGAPADEGTLDAGTTTPMAKILEAGLPWAVIFLVLGMLFSRKRKA